MLESVQSLRSSNGPSSGLADERRLRWLAWLSGVVCVLVRLPFVSHRLWDHDSVQFALGVEHYDLAAHHPHPPGYPLYIALLKVLAACGLEPVTAMVLVTLVASALGAACMPLLVRALLAPDGAGAEAGEAPGAAVFGTALFAAALFVFNPLLWFYGELPLLYGVEGGLTVVLAWGAARMVDGRWALVRAALLLALAGGLRPSSLVLLAPLVAFGLWRAWRHGAAKGPWPWLAAGLGGLAVLVWALPLFHYAGGYRAWKAINDEHFRTLLPATSVLYGAGFGALRHNLLLLAKWAAQGLFPTAVALLALPLVQMLDQVPPKWREVPPKWRRLVQPFGDRAGFLLAWAAPAIAFFALFHITKAGYTLVHLPAPLVGCALVATPWLGTARRGALAAVVAALVGGAIYLAGPDRLPGEPAWQVPWRHEFHGRLVRAFDTEIDALRDVLARQDPAASTLVTVELEGGGDGGAAGFLYSWHRHLQWYAPEFTVVALVPDERFALVTRGHAPFRRVDTEVPLPAGVSRLVFVLAAEPDLRFPVPPGEDLFTGPHFHVRAIPLPEDGRLGSFRFVPDR